MAELVYRIAIRVYLFGIYVAQWVHPKARAWVKGRQDHRQQLQEAAQKLSKAGSGHCYWMHCASLGEFEQGRPLLEALKLRSPDCRIVLSFFSPSGYQVRRHYALADAVVYLPADTPGEAHHFVALFRPDTAIFVKYEFWYQHLRALWEAEVPVYLVAGIFRPEQPFFRWYGVLHRRMLQGFTRIFVQDEASLQLLSANGYERVSLAGDPRADRVLAIREQATPIPELEQFVGERPCLVVGSSWPKDEQLLIPCILRELPSDWVVILAPHELHEAAMTALCERLGPEAFRFTQFKETYHPDKRFLVLDTIGMLATAYRYGQLAYVGGGFGRGIHNTLEPAAWGLPIIFGPRYHKFEEARALVHAGAAFPVEHAEDLSGALRRLLSPEARQLAGEAARQLVQERAGATETCLSWIAGRFSRQGWERNAEGLSR